MRKTPFIALLFLTCLSSNGQAWWGQQDNYWQCLLDELPDVKNDTVAESIVNQCKDSHPIHTRIFIEKNSSWFGFSSADQCVKRKAKSVRSEVAAQYLQAACYKLYTNK